MGSSWFDTEPSAAVEQSRHQFKTYTRSEPLVHEPFSFVQNRTRATRASLKLKKIMEGLQALGALVERGLRLALSEWLRSQFHRQFPAIFSVAAGFLPHF
jgi:hypothetical protein